MKKIGLICLALVLALGALGVGAALWMGGLIILGDVSTGSVDAIWSIDGVYKDGDVKDVSTLDVTMLDPWFMQIIIGNAYPSVTYTVEWNIMCTGTVPIHFTEPNIISDLPPATIFTFTDRDGLPIDWLSLQLHPEDPPILGMLTVHLDNDAEQMAYYVFDIMLEYGQYNESLPPPPPPPPPP
jgi:hypothetical protein